MSEKKGCPKSWNWVYFLRFGAPLCWIHIPIYNYNSVIIQSNGAAEGASVWSVGTSMKAPSKKSSMTFNAQAFMETAFVQTGCLGIIMPSTSSDSTSSGASRLLSGHWTQSRPFLNLALIMVSASHSAANSPETSEVAMWPVKPKSGCLSQNPTGIMLKVFWVLKFRYEALPQPINLASVTMLLPPQDPMSSWAGGLWGWMC